MKPTDKYLHCNHHHELTDEHQIVDFGNSEFRDWEKYEKENSETCSISKFLLKLELDIKIAQKEK